jgi:hypothetical protein
LVDSDGNVIAIGAMAMDFDEWKENVNQKGQACFILTHIKDKFAEDYEPEDEIKLVFPKPSKEKKVEKVEKEEEKEEEEKDE